MIIPIKQIILEDANTASNGNNANSGISGFYDKVAAGTNNIKFGKYGKKAKVKDSNVLKFSGLYGGGLGAVVGQTVDSFIVDPENPLEQIEPELTGNGLVGGALIGSGASALYGLNNNHKIITRDQFSNLKEKAQKLKEEYTNPEKEPLFKFDFSSKNKGK